jgi:hypothetical protein
LPLNRRGSKKLTKKQVLRSKTQKWRRHPPAGFGSKTWACTSSLTFATQKFVSRPLEKDFSKKVTQVCLYKVLGSVKVWQLRCLDQSFGLPLATLEFSNASPTT